MKLLLLIRLLREAMLLHANIVSDDVWVRVGDVYYSVQAVKVRGGKDHRGIIIDAG